MYRNLFLTIEVNLILWLVAAFRTSWDGWVIFGLVVAALLQHWAYYSLIKRKSDQEIATA